MKSQNRFFFFVLLFLPIFNYAQDVTATNNSSYFSNALFVTLLIAIFLLLIVIIALAQSLKNISASDYILNRFKKTEDKQGDDKNNATKITTVIVLLFAGYHASAQGINNSAESWLIGGLDMLTFYSMLTVIFLEAVVIMILYYQIMGFIKTEKQVLSQKPKTKTILEKLNASVDIEKEHDILLDHDYDGIKELDNDLPPWWKYGFYLTIGVAIVYLINFHVLGTGDLQKAEYDKSIVQAKIDLEEYMKTAANNVDETTVKELSGPDIEVGKELFIASCAACHGKDGRGTVGPNLTDEYWLHGGSVADIFKTIKYGWVDKGMKSWKDDLSPMQIAQITSFIRTLKGTNPAGAKAAQGDLYKEEIKTVTDSTQVISDTLVVMKDTLK